MTNSPMREEWVRSVQAYIATGKTEQAFSYLQQQVLNNRTQKNLAMLQAEYHKLKEEERMGTIGMDEKRLLQNQIHEKLLNLVQTGPPAGVASPGGNKLLWVFILLGLAAVGFLIWYNMQTPS